jgi:hypothetical protein
LNVLKEQKNKMNCLRDKCKSQAIENYVYCQKHINEELDILKLVNSNNIDYLKRKKEK